MSRERRQPNGSWHRGRTGRPVILLTLAALSGWLVLQQPGFLIAAFLIPALLAVSVDRGPPPVPEAGDTLTGLGGRDELLAQLAEAISATRPPGVACAVLVVEIDEFRRMQERLAPETLDQVQAETARRLVANVRACDGCARIGGATFAVAIGPMRGLDATAAEQLAERLRAALARTMRIDGQTLFPSVSIGLCTDRQVACPNAQRMLQSATLALIEGQRGSPGAVRSYDDAIRRRLVARERLARRADGALASGEIDAHFQPQVDAETGRITGVEALARWRPGPGPMIPPAEFLPAFEGAGLMPRLGHLMLQRALSALAEWDGANLGIEQVAVNVSAEDLRRADYADTVARELDRHGLPARRLAFEVLETVAAGPLDRDVRENIEALSRLGCRIELDDFGTGYASITTIRQFPIDRIKIDRSFVAGIDGEPEKRRLVGAILTMARGLGLSALAEGVETGAEREVLREMGCDQLQGFCIAPPMPREEIAGWAMAWQPDWTGTPALPILRTG